MKWGQEGARERKWSHVEASGRVESTSKERERESLGVRPGHIGFSGESWSMFPGSWLTRGIGYKATRPGDWFILSATPAHAALSRNYSVCLPLYRFMLSPSLSPVLSASSRVSPSVLSAHLPLFLAPPSRRH